MVVEDGEGEAAEDVTGRVRSYRDAHDGEVWPNSPTWRIATKTNCRLTNRIQTWSGAWNGWTTFIPEPPKPSSPPRPSPPPTAHSTPNPAPALPPHRQNLRRPLATRPQPLTLPSSPAARAGALREGARWRGDGPRRRFGCWAARWRRPGPGARGGRWPWPRNGG